ncbi:hypothetical protein MMC25_004299 [Agyrium rufum]|nr:hypothetical protein [Agyrium rufum]
MGKRGGRRFGGGGRGRGGGNRNGGRQTERTNYSEVTKENELYESYYNNLGILGEDEKSEFWAAMRRELPNSFRFTGSKGHALSVQKRLQDHYIPEITAITHNGELVNPPTAIPWYPDSLAWQMTTPKAVVRRFPPFASFQKFLVSETSVGNINRQEVVSMIPPLLMDLRPGMTVLDMCAAPGSKSAQLIEMIHAGEELRIKKTAAKIRAQAAVEKLNGNANEDTHREEEEAGPDWSDDGRATGLLIANDADYKRAHMLIHQMKRLNSPNIIVTNHDATYYPSIKLPSEPITEGERQQNRYLKFDRILADVPCSGDGTVRKNSNVWKDWTPTNALGLFITQVRILVRAIQMLKVGGRVVYSTCSMNPVENEAVVSAAIKRVGGTLKVDLVDCSEALPQLRRRHGLAQWKVMDRQGRTWSSWKEVEDYKVEKGVDGLTKLTEEMFPAESSSDQAVPSLGRCMRVYPHLQDTGGFFITVLEKKSEIKTKPEAPKKEETVRAAHSILDVVEEIEDRPVDGTDEIGHLDSLDEVAPSNTNNIVTDASAAARQNQENAPTLPVTAHKRELAEEGDDLAPTKRLKTRDDEDAIAPLGVENRQVHYPPPPGAELSITRPEENLQFPQNNDSSVPYKKKNNAPTEDPSRYLAPDHPELAIISEFYGLDSRFPRDRFMVRNAAGIPSKTIYYTSTLAKEILTENQGKGIKFTHCGIKMFVKQDVQRADVCRWRIQTEGMPILESWVDHKRVVRMWSKQTLRSLLKEMFPKVNGGGWKELGEIGERVRDLGMGCSVLRVEARGGEDGLEDEMVFPLWRSLHSLNLMLPKEDRAALLLRLYNDTSPIYDHSQERIKERQRLADSGKDSKEEVVIADDSSVEAEDMLVNADPDVTGEAGAADIEGDPYMAIEPNVPSEDWNAVPGVIDPVVPVADDDDQDMEEGGVVHTGSDVSPNSTEPATKFHELLDRGLVCQTIVDTLTRDMRLETMTLVQIQTINETLKGIDVLAQARTGTGKTVAFLLPILQNIITRDPSLERRSYERRPKGGAGSAQDIRAIIVSPTRELAEQIAVEARKVTKNTGIVVQTAVGGSAKATGLRQIKFEGCHVLVATPGRLKDILSDEYSGVKAPNCSAFVLDEADRLLDQGFYPDIVEIQKLLPDPRKVDRQTLLFSATVPNEVMKVVQQTMKPNFKFVQTVKEGEQQTHDTVPQKLATLNGFENAMPALLELSKRELEKNQEPFKAIVYFGASSEVILAHNVFENLRESGESRFGRHPLDPMKLISISARLSQQQRTRAADDFRRARTAILFSSDVTARGMDFPNVSHVIQIGIPSSRDTYIHRIGRTARAGKSGAGWLFMTPWEIAEAHGRLHKLPIKLDESLETAKVDMTKQAQLPEYVAKILTATTDAAKMAPGELKAAAYKACLGVYTWFSNKRTLVTAMNNRARFGWGSEKMPAINASLAKKLGIYGIPVRHDLYHLASEIGVLEEVVQEENQEVMAADRVFLTEEVAEGVTLEVTDVAEIEMIVAEDHMAVDNVKQNIEDKEPFQDPLNASNARIGDTDLQVRSTYPKPTTTTCLGITSINPESRLLSTRFLETSSKSSLHIRLLQQLGLEKVQAQPVEILLSADTNFTMSLLQIFTVAPQWSQKAVQR